MVFTIIGIANDKYNFKILNNNILLNEKNDNRVLLVKELIIKDNTFTIVFNFGNNYNLQKRNIPFKSVIMSNDVYNILIKKNTLKVVNENSNNLSFIFSSNQENDLNIIRTLIETVASTDLVDIIIPLKNCENAFYSCLQGDNTLKDKYLSFIKQYNSSLLTKNYDYKTKAIHYLIIAYIFKYYEQIFKNVDNLFDINEIIPFINQHINDSQEELLAGIKNELNIQTNIMKLVKKY